MLLLVVERVGKVVAEEAGCTLLVGEDMLEETLAEEDIVAEEDMGAGEGRLRYILENLSIFILSRLCQLLIAFVQV